MTNYQAELTQLKSKLQGQDPTLLLKAREELITIKKSLEPLFAEQLPASQLVEKLITEKNTLQDQLDTKRLASLQEFSKYQEKIKELQATELQELANLKKENQVLTQQKSLLEQRIKLLRSELSFSAEPSLPSFTPLLTFYALIIGFTCLISLLTRK